MTERQQVAGGRVKSGDAVAGDLAHPGGRARWAHGGEVPAEVDHATGMAQRPHHAVGLQDDVLATTVPCDATAPRTGSTAMAAASDTAGSQASLPIRTPFSSGPGPAIRAPEHRRQTAEDSHLGASSRTRLIAYDVLRQFSYATWSI